MYAKLCWQRKTELAYLHMCSWANNPDSALIGNIEQTSLATRHDVTDFMKSVHYDRSASVLACVGATECLDRLTAMTHNVDNAVQLRHSTHRV